MECPSCGIQLNEDGTVDVLDGEPDQHYADCTATFSVVAYAGADQAHRVQRPERQAMAALRTSP